jgi:spore maturation protein CgeB
MKLLVAGSDEIWSLEKFYVRHLSEAGVEVRTYPIQTIFYSFYNKNILNKILYKAGLSGINRQIEAGLKKVIIEWNPEIIWIFKGMELSPQILSWVKEKGIRLVNYNPDNPFIFSGRGSGNVNITRSIGLFDLHFTYDRTIQKRIIQEYGILSSILPFGYELSDALYAECLKQEEVLKVCFLGNPDSQRAQFIQELANDVVIDIYGHGWERYLSHKNITVFSPVYGKEFWKVLYRYRVQLNLMRPHNPDSHNMRSFEIPGVGGIGLFPKTSDHNLYFQNNPGVFLYSSMDECKKLAAEILGLSGLEAKSIRLESARESRAAGHSYKHRALSALAEIKKLL